MSRKFDVNNRNILRNRQCCAFTMIVAGGNPNGDPDRDGAPRMTFDNYGYITPVSLKQHWRAMFADHDSPVFQSAVEMFMIENPERCHIFESITRGYPVGTDPKLALSQAWDLLSKSEQDALDRYLDWRLFGTTSLEQAAKPKKGKKGKKASAQTESEDGEIEDDSEKIRFKRTGVITITPMLSITPILAEEATITKMAAIRDNLIEKGAGDMAPGASKFITFAVYYGMISVNPNVAAQTRTTIGDIELFKAMLKYAYSANESATRPAGSVRFHNIWWAEHTNALGSFDERKFFDAMKPRRKAGSDELPSKIEDFEFPSPPKGIEVIDLA